MTLATDLTRPVFGHAAGIEYLRRPAVAPVCSVVLLHGIGSNAGSFIPLMTALPATFDVVAWNAPGYAASKPLDMASPSPRDYAAALSTLLKELGLARIVLVGHSLGVLFAASLAANDSVRVAALALLSPALGYCGAADTALPPKVQDRIDEIETLGPQAFAAKRAARLVYEPGRKPQVLGAVRDAMAAVNTSGYVQAVRALGAGDLLADAARIAAPTLVAVGAEDVVTPPANARSLYAALANPAGYHEIANAGHALAQEDPVAVAQLLTQLIEARHG
jgi:pimeloyl-ACP methyl ester carboxylesterase